MYDAATPLSVKLLVATLSASPMLYFSSVGAKVEVFSVAEGARAANLAASALIAAASVEL